MPKLAVCPPVWPRVKLPTLKPVWLTLRVLIVKVPKLPNLGAVTVTFPSDLTYLPDGDKMTGEYEVLFVTASPEGALSDVAKQVHPVSFPARAQQQVLKKPFTHTALLIVRPGPQSISVAVVDRRGARAGYAKATFTAQ